MVSLLFLCTRRADLDHAAYVRRLLDGHVPLALHHHPTLRRYTVHIVERTPPGAAPLDSIGLLAFDTLEDFRTRLYDSPAGERIVARDVAGFLGGAHAYATTAIEHIAGPARPFGQRAPGRTLVCPIRRHPSLTHAAFVAHWQEAHVPLARRHHPRMTRYVTYVVDAALSPGAPAWDGFAEITLDAPEAPMFDDPAGEAVIRADMARFIGHTAAYAVAAYAQRG